MPDNLDIKANQRLVGHTFTSDELKKNFMPLLVEKCGKNARYNKLVDKVTEYLGKIHCKNEMIDKSTIQDILDILKTYTSDKIARLLDRKEVKFVNDLGTKLELSLKHNERLVTNTIENPSRVKKMDKRSILTNMKMLEPHIDCKEVEQAYNIYKAEFDDLSRTEEFSGNPTVY